MVTCITRHRKYSWLLMVALLFTGVVSSQNKQSLAKKILTDGRLGTVNVMAEALQAPGTGKPLADQWSINKYMMELLVKRYGGVK